MNVITTNGSYSLSFVTQILLNGPPGDDRKTLEATTSTQPLVQQLPCKKQPSISESYSEPHNSGMSDQLRDTHPTHRCCRNVTIYNWKVQNGKIEITPFVIKFRS